LGSVADDDDDDDSGLDVPFGINVGQAVGFEGGFAVSAIDGRGGKSHAIIAILGPSAEHGRQLDLGRVFGDADPPRMAGTAHSLVVALADADAEGRTMRLLRIDNAMTAARITKGADVSVSQNPSAAFTIAVNAERGVVSWEQTDKKTEKGQIVVAPFAVQGLSVSPKPLVVSDRVADAESPQVTARPGGYWLAWVQSDTPSIGHPSAKQAPPAPSAPATPTSADFDLEQAAVDLGERRLLAAALDLDGRAIKRPLPVTQGTSHVVAYDLATLQDGSALLAWRDDETSPGVESQVVRFGHLGLDGHIEYYRIEDDSIGVGAPQLLFDATMTDNDRTWLAVGNTGERVSLVRLQANGKPSSAVVADADLGVSNPLVRYGGELLVARQQGKGVELEPLRCHFND